MGCVHGCDLVPVYRCGGSTEEGLGGAGRLPRSSCIWTEASGGAGEGTPGPGTSKGYVSDTEPQKPPLEKLGKSALLSKVYRDGEAGGRKLVSLSSAGPG